MTTILLTLYFIGAAYTMDANIYKDHGKHALAHWSEQRQAAERDFGMYQDVYGEWTFRVDEEALAESRADLALRDVRVGQAVVAYGLVGLYQGRGDHGMAYVKFPEGVSQVMATDIEVLKHAR